MMKREDIFIVFLLTFIILAFLFASQGDSFFIVPFLFAVVCLVLCIGENDE